MRIEAAIVVLSEQGKLKVPITPRPWGENSLAKRFRPYDPRHFLALLALIVSIKEVAEGKPLPLTRIIEEPGLVGEPTWATLETALPDPDASPKWRKTVTLRLRE